MFLIGLISADFYISNNGIKVNNQITLSSLSGYNYQLDNGIYKAYFKKNSNTASFFRFVKDGYTIDYDLSGGSLNWIGRIGQPSATTTLGGGISSNTLDTIAVVSENIITYPLAYGNTNVTFELKNNRVKQTFVLSGLPSIKAYDELRYTGHVYFNSSLKICSDDVCYTPSGSQDTIITNSTIEFKDVNNKTIAYFDLPIIIDSKGNKVLGRYKIFGSNAQMSYAFRVPQPFLNSSSYPILIDPTTVTQAESNVLYEYTNFNISVTLKKNNGVLYEINPSDIFINDSDPNNLKFGAIDYNPVNSNEGDLNQYMYEWNSTVPLEEENGYYYMDKTNIWKQLANFFGINTYGEKYINTNDICSESYSNCIFNLSEDKKFLNVTFFAKVNNSQVLIDPSYVYVITSSSISTLPYPNQTEGSANGARLTAPVLYMNFNDPPEITYVKDNSIYNNYGILQ